MTTRRARKGWDDHLEGRGPSNSQGGPPTPPGPPEGTPDLCRPSQPHQDLQKRLLTPPYPPQGPKDPSLPSERASQLLPPLFGRPPDPSRPSGRTPDLSCPRDPSRLSGRASRPLLALRVGLPTPLCPIGRDSIPPGYSDGPPDPSRPSGRASRHCPAHRERLLTPPSPLEVPLNPSHSCKRSSRPLPALQECLASSLYRSAPSWLSGSASQPLPALQEDLTIPLAILWGIPTPTIPPNPSRPSRRTY